MPRARAEYQIVAQDRSSRALRNAQRNFQDLGTSVAVLQGPLGNVAGRLSSVSTGLSRIGPVGLAAGTALAALAGGSVKAAKAGAELARQQGRIEALVKTTGGAAGFTAVEIDKMARALGIATLASAEGARDAAGVLLTFKSISGDTFKTALTLSQDLAEVMGGDLKSSALQLGKALEDPVAGITALKRSGVSFTSTQRDMIKSMVEAGNKADAQKKILATLEAQIGGAGAGATEGLAGTTDTLRQRWKELLEQFDKTAGSQDSVSRVLNMITSGIERATRALENFGKEDVSKDSLLKQRATLLDRIAEKEEKIQASRDMGMLNVGLMEQDLRADKNRLIGIEAAIRVNKDFADTEARLAEARRKKAAETAKENEKEEQRNTLMDRYQTKLDEVRRSLGSTTLAAKDQENQLNLLRFAFSQGHIEMEEFLELQKKLNDEKEKATKGGSIDFFPGFVGTRPPSTTPSKPEANDEEKKQTAELRKIHGVLTNLNTPNVSYVS